MNTKVPNAAAEAEVVEMIDLEEHAKTGCPTPKAKIYKVRINKDKYEFDIFDPTREQLLEKAGLVPVNDWTLRLKMANGKAVRIHPGQHVDLRQPGVEKFKALPREQTEG